MNGSTMHRAVRAVIRLLLSATPDATNSRFVPANTIPVCRNDPESMTGSDAPAKAHECRLWGDCSVDPTWNWIGTDQPWKCSKRSTCRLSTYRCKACKSSANWDDAYAITEPGPLHWDWVMIFRFLLAGTLSMAIAPGTYAQRVNFQAFSPANGDQIPFVIRSIGPVTGGHQSNPEEIRGLVDDFEALGSKKSLAQADTRAHHVRALTQKTNRDRPDSPQSPVDTMLQQSQCENRPYAPSPHLPRDAERRRAIWYPAMAQAACEAGLPVHLFDALIIQESRYNPVAVSPKGATGLAQLMPASARILGVRNILDPRENMRGGARYLRALLDEFGRFDLALAAYNAGAGRVRATGRVPRITETIHYVSNILVTMQRQLSAPMPLRE
ncbi:lytic transglycosylase domain-containing protein [Novosphingobium umbonatum]|nr:lytic transglycosylase domain-containing protein [Novosphingobium umbonatum]